MSEDIGNRGISAPSYAESRYASLAHEGLSEDTVARVLVTFEDVGELGAGIDEIAAKLSGVLPRGAVEAAVLHLRASGNLKTLLVD